LDKVLIENLHYAFRWAARQLIQRGRFEIAMCGLAACPGGLRGPDESLPPNRSALETRRLPVPRRVLTTLIQAWKRFAQPLLAID
jgi:hypothetical protein